MSEKWWSWHDSSVPISPLPGGVKSSLMFWFWIVWTLEFLSWTDLIMAWWFMSGCYFLTSRPWLLFALKWLGFGSVIAWVILSAKHSPLAFLKGFCVLQYVHQMPVLVVYSRASLVLTELCDLSAKLGNGNDQTLLFLARRKWLWI